MQGGALGQLEFGQYTTTVLIDYTPSGGLLVGSSANVSFVHGVPANSDIVVEWDFDNDGDFSTAVEDITSYVLSVETSTGRDWPSQLTGKAGPGRFRATLNNEDDRFSFFNTSSPLNTTPYSLKTGRKLRVRTSTASNPDPTLLAKDRFRRANGALGTSETGLVWSLPLANDPTILSGRAVAASEGNAHIAVVDTGVTNYYAQVIIPVLGHLSNQVGVVYRYQDSSNYSRAVIDISSLTFKIIDVVAGVASTIASIATTEVYDNMTIGALVSGSSVSLYHEGVNVLSATAIQTDETEVGFYQLWATGDTKPEIDEFYCWTGLTAETEGILWTGDLVNLSTSVAPGPKKLATIEGSGWLARMANQTIAPPTSVDGRKTGVLVGNALGLTGLLSPPGNINAGDITTGAMKFDDIDALEAARRFEETEFGFLYEMQEGPISYDSRTARDSAVSQAAFSDLVGSQFGYAAITPYDWGKEVINRVFAGVAAGVPDVVSVTTTSQNTTLSTVSMPATVASGDLLIAFISLSSNTAIQTQYIPLGWVELINESPTYTHRRILAKVADGTEDGTTIKFAEIGSGTPCVDEVTEMFTRNGWKNVTQVNGTDETLGINPQTGKAEWTQVTQIRKFKGEHKTYLLQGKGFDAAATWAHRWIIQRDNEWMQVTTGELEPNDIIPCQHDYVRVSDLSITDGPTLSLVWCPTTYLGSWLARRGAGAFFTGNKPF